MVYRIYTEKQRGLDNEASTLLHDIRSYLLIDTVKDVRILNRYDVEGISEELFNSCVPTVFSEPQTDITCTNEPKDADTVFAVEYLPGQFDQRAESAAQCIQLISCKERPRVRTAKVYCIYGTLTDSTLSEIKKYVINPVEAREAVLTVPQTLSDNVSAPEKVDTITGFISYSKDELGDLLKKMGLAMDIDDLAFLQEYFVSEKRDPTVSEIRVLDTYWSDHCRHTTFLTSIDDITITDPLIKETFNEFLTFRKELGRDKKPVTLMEIATFGTRYLKKQGLLPKLDESEEINACTVKVDVTHNDALEKWLLLFKNETHNHPTEIEPFGGAATCIGGAIRDPLSGRAYVYGAMRVTGAADPTVPLSETIPGKLPQKKLTATAAAGYSSYGNQIGLATGLVDELYHPGYAAKRMEIGAVIAAAPAENVRRETPLAGDVVILMGGRTGRDGCGGATGSSKSHNTASLSVCGAEVQKGNAPEERKLQRLFRNPKASGLIKRCNDFGAGGVSVAIGELADGLAIELDKVPKKYAGLDGTELAISESQERMAVVVAESDCKTFMELCSEENIEATVVAHVTEEPRLRMDWNGQRIVDISREFLNSNGSEKHVNAELPVDSAFEETYITSRKKAQGDFSKLALTVAADLNCCSKQGLSERFDSTIGAATVLMPFGGKYQTTPIQAMVHKLPVLDGNTKTCSLMAYGFNPYITKAAPFRGSYIAVIESVCKLIATGAQFKEVYLTFQEYFGKPGHDPKRFGLPVAALLGSLKAQLDLGIASIGGKDSMSGSFEKLDVPPTLCSFAVTVSNTDRIVSPEFKQAGNPVYIIRPEYENGIPKVESLKKCFALIEKLNDEKKLTACYTPTAGGIFEAVMKMSLGNRIGFTFDNAVSINDIFAYSYGSFIVELTGEEASLTPLGRTGSEEYITFGNEKVSLEELNSAYTKVLEPVFPTVPKKADKANTLKLTPDTVVSEKLAAANTPSKSVNIITSGKKPVFLIPVFPGTNCEYDSARAVERSGGKADIFVIKNLTASDITESVNEFTRRIAASNVIFIPGGFSGADEPDGSAKLITAFFRNPEISEEVHKLLKERDGLMCGICNGFQALIKLGLLTNGTICDPDPLAPTLTFNTIGRHQSRLVQTAIVSSRSPWLMETRPGDIHTVPISHGEGRFFANEAALKKLIENDQIATKYVDLQGNPTMDIAFNPNGSLLAIEGITSPDGRVIGKMGHSERISADTYKNVPGDFDNHMFASAVKYFSL